MEKNTKKAYTLAELEEMNQAFNKRIATARAEIEQNKREIDAINEKMDIPNRSVSFPNHVF